MIKRWDLEETVNLVADKDKFLIETLFKKSFYNYPVMDVTTSIKQFFLNCYYKYHSSANYKNLWKKKKGNLILPDL